MDHAGLVEDGGTQSQLVGPPRHVRGEVPRPLDESGLVQAFAHVLGADLENGGRLDHVVPLLDVELDQAPVGDLDPVRSGTTDVVGAGGDTGDGQLPTHARRATPGLLSIQLHQGSSRVPEAWLGALNPQVRAPHGGFCSGSLKQAPAGAARSTGSLA
jgi:hypothetical protein